MIAFEIPSGQQKPQASDVGQTGRRREQVPLFDCLSEAERPAKVGPRDCRPPRGAHLRPVPSRDVGKPRYRPRHALPLPGLSSPARHRGLRPEIRPSRQRRGPGGTPDALPDRGHRPPAHLHHPPDRRRQQPHWTGHARHNPHLHLPR